MPEMPAFCQNCGAIFSSGMVFDNCTNLKLSGNIVQCPRCGGIGKVPDGVFDIVGDVINVLSATKNTINNLNKLNNILKNAKKLNYSHEEIKSKIEEDLPELSSLSDVLPKTRTELYAFVALILTTIGLAIAYLSSSSNNQISELKIKEITEQAIEKSLTKQNGITYQKNTLPKNKKTGRNKPCPCGSGKKFKKCCISLYA